LNAGRYGVDEAAVSGYTKTLGANCSGTIANGETKSCTITNDDQPGTLHVIKHVINDDGGTKVAGDFSLTVTGTNVQLSATFPGAEAPGTTVTLNAGSYSVDETAVSGYTKTLGADCAGAIANGETKTCTVTNNDEPGTLIVIKRVINDNGGTRVAGDFSLTVTATNVQPGATFAGAEAPGTTVTLNVGNYSVDEGAVSGYAKSLSADCAGVIGNGEIKTCTITNDDIINDDIQPKLYVIKHVVNNNGGVSTASSFTMNVSGPSASPTSFPGSESPGMLITLNAGSFSVGETPQPLYVRSDNGDCSGTIGIGEVKTCTITNNDLYDFRGFFNPVENLPKDNKVNAGRALPLKWELRDHVGNYVLNLDAVDSIQYLRVACSAGEVITAMPLDADDSGASGLRITDNQFHFNWKTEKGFANMCMELRVTLDDGTPSASTPRRLTTGVGSKLTAFWSAADFRCSFRRPIRHSTAEILCSDSPTAGSLEVCEPKAVIRRRQAKVTPYPNSPPVSECSHDCWPLESAGSSRVLEQVAIRDPTHASVSHTAPARLLP
jgi:hypothetical protein